MFQSFLVVGGRMQWNRLCKVQSGYIPPSLWMNEGGSSIVVVARIALVPNETDFFRSLNCILSETVGS